MKKIVLILLVITTFPVVKLKAQATGIFTDARDGKKYITIIIGTQTWMAENLNYETKQNGQTYSVTISNGTWMSKREYDTEQSWCYNNDDSNCKIYGRLYSFEAAEKACPKGWYLPSKAEWQILIKYLGGKNKAGGKLKGTGTIHWKAPNTDATNESWFTALPGGSWNPLDGLFYDQGSYGYWWSAEDYLYSMSFDHPYVKRERHSFVSPYISVRCVKDN